MKNNNYVYVADQYIKCSKLKYYRSLLKCLSITKELKDIDGR